LKEMKKSVRNKCDAHEMTIIPDEEDPEGHLA
jgi:hypothetical protein